MDLTKIFSIGGLVLTGLGSAASAVSNKITSNKKHEEYEQLKKDVKDLKEQKN